MVKEAHARHVSGDRAVHLLQGSPMAKANDEAKHAYATSASGRAVAAFVRWEQTVLGEWKEGLVREAAGADYSSEQARCFISAARTPVTLVPPRVRFVPARMRRI